LNDEPGWDLFRTANHLGVADLLELDAPRVLLAISSYDRYWQEEFALEHDHFRLLGQDNIRRYLPFREIRVRVAEGDTLFDLFCRPCAARVTGARIIVSFAPQASSPVVELLDRLTDSWAGKIEFVEESDEDLASLIRNMPEHPFERIRYANPARVPSGIRRAAAETGVYIADQPVLSCGRIELLWYLREQSISFDYHRYGNLGARAEETRRGPVPLGKD
jgi:RHH-type proline utilization regulon transcriptional repressor/proline dehydrogenase/delta 1-pyrroline-5-carboxylate dehydrogenase